MEPNLIYLVGFFILLVIGLILIILKLNSRITKLLQGKKAETLEDTLVHIIEEINRMNSVQKDTDKILKNLNTRVSGSITGVGIVRFNPFANSGGNQSFAIALLNELGDGVIVSTLYSREKTSVYAKPVKKLKSEYELTKEEAEALSKATR